MFVMKAGIMEKDFIDLLAIPIFLSLSHICHAVLDCRFITPIPYRVVVVIIQIIVPSLIYTHA